MNSIAIRIVDFLKEFPPFNDLSQENLLQIVSSTRVIRLEKNKTLFRIDDPLHDCFYVVASGVVNLFVISDADEQLLNKCFSGDIFGLRPFFAKNNYMMTARAREDSVLYAIPIQVFRPFVAGNPQVLNFLLESFATNTRNPDDKKRGKLLSDNGHFTDQQPEIQYFQSLSYNRSPLKSARDASIMDTAQMMTDNLMDSIIITEGNRPVGIVTDMDFRTKVATGRFPVTSRVEQIMSAPVITVDENVSLAEAQLLMLKNNITHLCVTQDGSDNSDIRGVIAQRDLVVAQASNPGVLMKEIKRSQNAGDLRQVRAKLTDLVATSISKNIPIIHINNIAGEINLAMVRRAIELAILGLGSPPAPFAWLSIGSQGRKEQLLLTDQDSILVFEDVAPEKYRDVKDYFLKLAKTTVAVLEHVGYPTCPNGFVASNMLWCKAKSDWVKQYTNWMMRPGETNNDISSIFFDFELAYGDQKLEEALTDAIFANIAAKSSSFFDYLGNDALRKPPPLSFFKKFNVEDEGEHQEKFDIKTRALMPLIDGARLMILSHNVRGINNTYQRFKQLAMVEPRHADIYLNCAEAFLKLSWFRTQEGLKYDSDGQYINIKDMSRTDRERLKNALAPMKDLEDLIKDKFRLTQFS